LRTDGFFANYRLREAQIKIKPPSKPQKFKRILLMLVLIYIGLFLPVTGVILYAIVRPHDEILGKVLGYATLLGVLINISLYMYAGLTMY